MSRTGRPVNPDLNKAWKILLPATLAGRVEYMFLDTVHSKPLYGARAKLITALLERWVAEQSGTPPAQLPEVPSLDQLREMCNA